MPEDVADTSPPQYLHQSGLLELLPALYGQVTVLGAVAAELKAGRVRGIDLPDPEALSWVSVRAPQGQALLPLITELGAGEWEALALERSGSVVILDDGLECRYAKLLGLRMTGDPKTLMCYGHGRENMDLNAVNFLSYASDPGQNLKDGTDSDGHGRQHQR